MTGRDTTRELVKIIIQMYRLDPTLVLGFSHDRASVSTMAVEQLEPVFFRAEDWPCFPHTLDHVGGHFIHMHLDGFWQLWINIFAYGARLL